MKFTSLYILSNVSIWEENGNRAKLYNDSARFRAIFECKTARGKCPLDQLPAGNCFIYPHTLIPFGSLSSHDVTYVYKLAHHFRDVDCAARTCHKHLCSYSLADAHMSASHPSLGPPAFVLFSAAAAAARMKHVSAVLACRREKESEPTRASGDTLYKPRRLR